MSRRKSARKGKPVSEGIRRAAKRAFPNGAPKSDPKPHVPALVFTPEMMAWAAEVGLPLDVHSLDQWNAKQLAARPMTFSLGELCAVIGCEVKSEDFATTALEAISQEIESGADLAERCAGFAIWRHLSNIAKRAEFAAKLQRQLAGGAS